MREGTLNGKPIAAKTIREVALSHKLSGPYQSMADSLSNELEVYQEIGCHTSASSCLFTHLKAACYCDIKCFQIVLHVTCGQPCHVSYHTVVSSQKAYVALMSHEMLPHSIFDLMLAPVWDWLTEKAATLSRLSSTRVCTGKAAVPTLEFYGMLHGERQISCPHYVQVSAVETS